MGDRGATCGVSGLGIDDGTPVRALLLVATPHDGWCVRVPPLRAVHDGRGSIRDVHPEDASIVALWQRGLREDLVEVGPGDNPLYDPPASKDMSFEALLVALSSGRVEVRQDVSHRWRRPPEFWDDDPDAREVARRAATPDLRSVTRVLTSDAAFVARYPDAVSRTARPGKFLVDEPVPFLVRVRFGHHEYGEVHLAALEAARAAVTRARFAGVVGVGSGRYADDAELLVVGRPGVAEHVPGPRWDEARGHPDDPDRPLQVTLALVREDVWRALVAYPHERGVDLDCTTCGQAALHHGEDLTCPSASVDGESLRVHPPGARYTHGPVFPIGIPHALVRYPHREVVWFGLDAIRSQVHATWEAFRAYFRGEVRTGDGPHRFDDFPLRDHLILGALGPGSWILCEHTPGAIRIGEHLAMYLADEVDVPAGILDALAELAAVELAMVHPWRPSCLVAPPAWDRHARLARTLLGVAEAECARRGEIASPSTLAETTARDHDDCNAAPESTR